MSTWVIALKTVKNDWVVPQNIHKTNMSFYTPDDALKIVKKYPDLMERWINKYKGLKIINIKYSRKKIREQDIIKEYDDQYQIIEVRKLLEKYKNESAKKTTN